jgi:hypothetical protein
MWGCVRSSYMDELAEMHLGLVVVVVAFPDEVFLG